MPRWPGSMATHIRPTSSPRPGRRSLFNQFHDLAAGSGIGIIYKDAQKDYDQVHWATNEISPKSLDTLSRRT